MSRRSVGARRLGGAACLTRAAAAASRLEARGASARSNTAVNHINQPTVQAIIHPVTLYNGILHSARTNHVENVLLHALPLGVSAGPVVARAAAVVGQKHVFGVEQVAHLRGAQWRCDVWVGRVLRAASGGGGVCSGGQHWRPGQHAAAGCGRRGHQGKATKAQPQAAHLGVLDRVDHAAARHCGGGGEAAGGGTGRRWRRSAELHSGVAAAAAPAPAPACLPRPIPPAVQAQPAIITHNRTHRGSRSMRHARGMYRSSSAW